MESSLLTVLPNLSIGAIAVLALVYVTKIYIGQIKELAHEHAKHIKEREDAMRALEKEVRTSIMSQLEQNTQAMSKMLYHLEK